jgi:ubiquinone/menaquinone biosynthesis methyltransferase
VYSNSISIRTIVLADQEAVAKGAEETPLKRTFALKFSDHADQPARKKFYNEQLFSEVAPKYDFVTKALSLGRDAAWKRHLVNALPDDTITPRCVDLACGTGDVSFLLADRYPNGTVTGIDLTESMLKLARQRQVPKNLSFTQGDMCDTGIESGSIDIVTGSYALRNAPNLEQALIEIRRILKPGGMAAFLDFSKPTMQSLQAVE